MKKGEKVVILGASSKHDRYSYKALVMLEEYGHIPIPVHPSETKIEGYECHRTLDSVREKIGKVDTLTIYVNSEISTELRGAILLLAPKRVIFNPGAENEALRKILEEKKIKTVDACTLVMLRVGNF